MADRKFIGSILAISIGAGLWACSGPVPVLQTGLGDARAQTAGERFRERYEARKRECEKAPPVPEGMDCTLLIHARKAVCQDSPATQANCNLLKVQIEDPMATPEGRFAHSIAIPNPMPADAGYRAGMSPGEYFQHLCKTYAGEFIYKTVDNVAGIRQLRLREPASSYKFEHLYAMEDPYGHDQEEAEEPGFQFVGAPWLYEFFERPLPATRRGPRNKQFWDASMFAAPPKDATVERYFGHNGKRNSLKLEFDTQPKARYAFTWRGIMRPADRELGIAGGELIVLDTETNEVMGVRRGFAFYRGSWAVTPLCPRYGYFGGFDKATGFTAWHTTKVVRTPQWKELLDDQERTRLPRRDMDSKK